nr:MAG TPA: hypothetical protein [Caudoviricetes sp.]
MLFAFINYKTSSLPNFHVIHLPIPEKPLLVT